MSFGGRWVPMEVTNTLVLLWAIAVLLAGAALYWFMRSGRATKTRQTTLPENGRGKRKKRKRR